MLNYDQIESCEALFLNFWLLTDEELLENLSMLPDDWVMYIVSSNIFGMIGKEGQENFIQRGFKALDKLGIDKNKKLLSRDTMSSFYQNEVIYMETALNISSEVLNNEEKNLTEAQIKYIKRLNPQLIDYLKIIALGREQYEILNDIKHNVQLN